MGYSVALSVLDINCVYKNYFHFMRPDIRFIHKDIFKLDETFDLCIASHVIEHVKEPLKFVRRLQSICTGQVLVQAPWKEKPEILTKGHINIFDEEFISELNPTSTEFVTSPAWGYFLDPKYEVFISVLEGELSPPE